MLRRPKHLTIEVVAPKEEEAEEEDTLLADLPNTAHSCNRQAVLAAWFNSERPYSSIHLSGTFKLLAVHSELTLMWIFLKRTENDWWCVRSFPLTYLPRTPTPKPHN
jgi:hypothetical protein